LRFTKPSQQPDARSRELSSMMRGGQSSIWLSGKLSCTWLPFIKVTLLPGLVGELCGGALNMPPHEVRLSMVRQEFVATCAPTSFAQAPSPIWRLHRPQASDDMRSSCASGKAVGRCRIAAPRLTAGPNFKAFCVFARSFAGDLAAKRALKGAVVE